MNDDVAQSDLQQDWLRFLTLPQPMPPGNPDLESFQALQKEKLRDLIGEALSTRLLQPEPLLIQFVHIQPDAGRPYFGITTVGKNQQQLPILVAYTGLHLRYVQEKGISFFKNAATLMEGRGIVALFSTKASPDVQLANSDFVSVQVSDCSLYQVNALPDPTDFEDVPNASGYRSFSDAAYQKFIADLTTTGATPKEPRTIHCDTRVEDLIGGENKAQYFAHLAPLLVHHHLVCCAPALYDHGAEKRGNQSGAGGCVFLIPVDQKLSSSNLEDYYLFTHKLCTMAAMIPEIAAAISQTEVQSFSEELKDRLPQIARKIQEVESVFEGKGLYQRSPLERSRLPLFTAVAKTNIPVLITGASGSGKETTAKKIATASGRKETLTRLYSCANISATLAESELFGHVKGAFTDAKDHSLGAILAASGYADGSGSGDYYKWLKKGNPGLNETDYEGETCYGLTADSVGGTLILDEFGSLEKDVEAKLLRAIDGRPIRPKGWNGPGFLPYVRTICITNQSLAEQREDLRYRIGGFHIQEPKLSEKLESVEAAIEERFTRLSIVGEPEIHYKLTQGAKSQLMKPSFLDGLRGNFRELRWLVQRACLHAYLRPGSRSTINQDDVQKALEHRLLIDDPTQDEEELHTSHMGADPDEERLRRTVSEIFPSFDERGNWTLVDRELGKLTHSPQSHAILKKLEEAFHLCRGDKLKTALRATIKAGSIRTTFGRHCTRLGYKKNERGRKGTSQK